MNAWLYKGSPVPADFDISEYYGFTYRITNLKNNRQYLGRKYLWSFRRIGKGRKKKIESKWRDYWGSCKELKRDIKRLGYRHFKREILDFYRTKAQVNYNETRLLFRYDVLTETFDDGEYKYYNSNILGRYYRGNIE